MRKLQILLVVLILTASTSVYADEITFKNGDHLTGKVVHIGDGKVTFAPELADEMVINVINLSSIRTDSPVTIVFTDGSIAYQPLIVSATSPPDITDLAYFMSTSEMTKIIREVNPPPAPSPRWNGSITSGLNSATGNTDSNTANINIKLGLKGGKNRISTKAGYNFGRQKDQETGETSTTQDDWFVKGKLDRFYDDKSFIYTSGQLEQDRVSDLDNRLIVGFGFGHQFIDQDDFTLSAEGGAAWLTEKYSGSEKNEEWSIQLGYSLDKKLGSNLALSHETSFLPAFDNLDDYLLSTEIGLKSDLMENMFASFKIILDYDSTPSEGLEKTDLQYILGLGFDID